MKLDIIKATEGIVDELLKERMEIVSYSYKSMIGGYDQIELLNSKGDKIIFNRRALSGFVSKIYDVHFYIGNIMYDVDFDLFPNNALKSLLNDCGRTAKTYSTGIYSVGKISQVDRTMEKVDGVELKRGDQILMNIPKENKLSWMETNHNYKFVVGFTFGVVFITLSYTLLNLIFTLLE